MSCNAQDGPIHYSHKRIIQPKMSIVLKLRKSAIDLVTQEIRGCICKAFLKL